MNFPLSRISRNRASSRSWSGAYCALTSISGICTATHSSGLGPPVDEIRRAKQNACHDGVLGVFEAVIELLVAGSEPVAHAGDGEGPHGGSHQGEEGIRSEGHLEHPGRNRDERADDRRDPADEHADVTPAHEPALGAVEPLGREVEPAAASLEQRPAAEAADPPAEQRAGEITEPACER